MSSETTVAPECPVAPWAQERDSGAAHEDQIDLERRRTEIGNTSIGPSSVSESKLQKILSIISLASKTVSRS